MFYGTLSEDLMRLTLNGHVSRIQKEELVESEEGARRRAKEEHYSECGNCARRPVNDMSRDHVFILGYESF